MEPMILVVDLRGLPKKRREAAADRLVLSDRRGVLLWIRTS